MTIRLNSLIHSLIIVCYILKRFNFQSVYPQNSCGKPQVEPNINGSALNRIINGVDAVPNSWPWTVSLRLASKYTSHYCAGTLIYENVVLTAAHCVNTLDAFEILVFAGINNINTELGASNAYFVSHRYFHESYNAQLIQNDIAILVLVKNVSISREIQLACLPASSTDSTYAINKTLALIGWGSTNDRTVVLSPTLKETTMKVINGETVCNVPGISDQYDPSKVYCAIDRNYFRTGLCKGDSGGPLVMFDNSSWFVYGVASYVIKNSAKDKICIKTEPSYFTQVPVYLKWIEYGINFTKSGQVQPKNSNSANKANYSHILNIFVFINIFEKEFKTVALVLIELVLIFDLNCS